MSKILITNGNKLNCYRLLGFNEAHPLWESREVLEEISVPNRQNTVPLHLVKWKYRALKFLVHFSSFLHTNVPQK